MRPAIGRNGGGHQLHRKPGALLHWKDRFRAYTTLRLVLGNADGAFHRNVSQAIVALPGPSYSHYFSPPTNVERSNVAGGRQGLVETSILGAPSWIPVSWAQFAF